MAFGSPTSDETHAQYGAYFSHTNGQRVVLTQGYAGANPEVDPTDMDAAFADAIALLDGSSEFTFQGASKSYSTMETYS